MYEYVYEFCMSMCEYRVCVLSLCMSMSKCMSMMCMCTKISNTYSYLYTCTYSYSYSCSYFIHIHIFITCSNICSYTNSDSNSCTFYNNVCKYIIIVIVLVEFPYNFCIAYYSHAHM